jgi:hypothetical protein
MRDELRSLGLQLRTWFAVVTSAVTLWWFLNSRQPLSIKLGVASLLFLGAYTIVVVRLTGMRERVRHGRHTRGLEHEIRRLREEGPVPVRERTGRGEQRRRAG